MRIMDIRGNSVRFQPGDHVIVRIQNTGTPLTQKQMTELRKKVDQILPDYVEPIIIDLAVMDMEGYRGAKRIF